MPRTVPPLTDRKLATLKPPATGSREVWDGKVTGLGLRVFSTGRRKWVVKVRVGQPGQPGKSFARATLGEYPSMSLREARDLAGPKLAELRSGRPAGDGTFGQVLAEFLEHEVPRLRSGARLRRLIEDVIAPALAHKRLADLRRRDALDLVDGYRRAGKPAAAHKCHAVLKRLGTYAAERELVEVPLFAGLKAPPRPEARERTLTDAELGAVWRAADAVQYPFGPMLRLMILTGQRLRECAELRWREVDLKGGWWDLPAERSKNKRGHRIPLPQSACHMLEDLRQLPLFTAGDHCFSYHQGARAVTGFSSFKRRLDAASGTNGWTLHDIRRTCRTGWAAMGVRREVAELLMNHAQGDPLARTYDRFSYGDQQREALEKWSRHVARLAAGLSLVESERA